MGYLLFFYMQLLYYLRRYQIVPSDIVSLKRWHRAEMQMLWCMDL